MAMIIGDGIMPSTAQAGAKMVQVKLPPAYAWDDAAADWLAVGATGTSLGLQTYLNGAIYLLFASTVYVVDPETGAVTDSFKPTGPDGTFSIDTLTSSFPNSMISDGKRYLYAAYSGYLYRIDTTEKTYTRFSTGQSMTHTLQMVHDPTNDRVYIFYSSENASSGVETSSAVSMFDPETIAVTALAPRLSAGAMVYAWLDQEEQAIYYGFCAAVGTSTSTGGTIAKYDIATDTHTTIAEAVSLVSQASSSACIYLRDRMYKVRNTGCQTFDPKTGELYDRAVPAVRASITIPGVLCEDGISIYHIGGGTLYRCVPLAEQPTDTPILCKLYKWNKVHALVPLEIKNKLSITTMQQTMGKDIEIRLGDYTSPTGATLYIEA